MKLTLRQARYLVLVAARGSISAAAREAGISQSSILAAIDMAEAEMNARLFVRRPARGVVVTPVGERFLASARVLLSAEAEFSRTLADRSTTKPRVLRIGCFAPFGALFVAELLRRFIGTDMTEVELLEGEQPQLVSWLNGGVVEVALTYDIGPGLPSDAIPLARVPAHALLHRDDELAREPAVRLTDLASRPVVLLDLPQTSGYLTALFHSQGVQPRVAYRARSYDSVRAAVACGFGVALLNLPPIGDASPDSHLLVRRPLVEDLPAPTLLAADIYGEHKPQYLREFYTFAGAFFRDLGPSASPLTRPELTSSSLG